MEAPPTVCVRPLKSGAELTTLLQKEGARPFLIYFTASWCGPCRRMAAPLEALSKEYGARLDIYKIDIEALPQIATQYRVEVVPTFILFKNGHSQGIVQGANLSGVRELLQYC